MCFVCVLCVNACDVRRIGFVKKEEYICKNIYKRIGIKFLVNTHDRGDNKQKSNDYGCVCVYGRMKNFKILSFNDF